MIRVDDNKMITKQSKLRSPLDVVFEKIKQTGLYPSGGLSAKMLKDLLTWENAVIGYSSQEDLGESVKDEMAICVDWGKGTRLDLERGIEKGEILKGIEKLEKLDPLDPLVPLDMAKLENPWVIRMTAENQLDPDGNGNREAEGMKGQELNGHNGQGRSRSMEHLEEYG